LADFSVDHLYSNSEGTIVAAKFSHVPSGAPVFFLQLETIPEVLTWVDSPLDSDRGLAHSLEHLLIVKGVKGRYLNLLKLMRLSNGNAATGGDFVYYGLSSQVGVDGVFEQLHALMDALYRPDFSGDEAEREFYHFAVADSGGKKTLIEGGTVYDEQLSNQDRYKYIFELYKRVLGENNPFAFNNGGEPDVMRDVTPEDIRRFHDRHYKIGPTTGFIFSFPPKENVAPLLERLSLEFKQFYRPGAVREQASPNEPKYPIHPSRNLDPAIYPFPGPNEAAPGFVHFAWAPAKSRNLADLRMLELFSQALAVGEDCLLHNALIDSQKRIVDSGATGVDSALFLGISPAFPVVILEVSGIPGNRISAESMGQLRAAILAKIREVSEYPDHSRRLAEFNRLAESYASSLRRSESVWTKNPPGFDAYPPQTNWKEYFERLELDSSFTRSLSRDAEWQTIDNEIKSEKNVWRSLIAEFHLLDTPYVTATAPSSSLLEEIDKRKQYRIRRKIAELMSRYETSDEQQALARFEQDELAKTGKIDAIAGNVPHPRFTDRPPLTPDDSIRYKQFEIEGVPVIASLFEQPPTIDIGLSFDLRRVPHKYYKYLQFFPQCLDSVGLKMGDRIMRYPEMTSRIHREVFAFSASNDMSPVSHRADLTMRASAANIQEFRGALKLLQDAMTFNYLEASNLGRLRDIVANRISSDNLYPRLDASITNAGYGFRYEGDGLYLALNSRFTGAHLDNRLKWLLHEPVSPPEVDKLQAFASDVLSPPAPRTKQELVQKLDMLHAQGLEKELVAYWKSSLLSLPEMGLTEGLRRLAGEVEEDLRAGPDKTIEDLRALQKIILDRKALHVDLTLSEPILTRIRPDLMSFLASIPTQSREDEISSSQTSDPARPLIAELNKRYHSSQQQPPLYVGFVNPSRTGGDVIFSADFPDYSQLDARSLTTVLASGLFAGAGPESFQIKTLARGLAYHNTIGSNPAISRIWYYADRSPDVTSLVKFVNETASGATDFHDPSVVDYTLSYRFSFFSRAGLPFSERGKTIAQDIRDGNTPEKVKKFSEAILALRKDSNLFPELTYSGLSAACAVLLRDDCRKQQQAQGSQFFFQGSEQVLSDIERGLPISKLLRLYPSDFWINY
jgi:hypothetical protein